MNVPEKLEVPVVVKDTDGNKHEVERLVYRLERNGKSRWHELFGTPERAARTIANHFNHEDWADCDYCPLQSKRCYEPIDECAMDEEGKLLEWLKGENDGE